MNGAQSPPRRPQLSREVVLRFRRRRFADALAELCAERGYRGTTVADVVTRAGTGRNAFYDVFANKEAAFLGLLDIAGRDLFARVEAGCETGGEDSFARIEAGLAAVVGWVAERPDDAWACMVEAARATPATLDRQDEAITRFAAILREHAPSAVPRPPTLEESLVGGVHEVLAQLMRAGETERAPGLVPDLSALLLAPYLSGRRARE